MLPTIVVYNESAHVTDVEAQGASSACQRQLTEHFEPIWNASAVIHFAKAGEAPPANAWVFRLVDKIDVSGALGYHSNGLYPYALIDVWACIQDTIAWSSCLSHEVLEAVADPDCVWCADVGGKVYSLEVCDATERTVKLDGTIYEIDGFEMENFVTPDWFVPGSAGPWDFLGALPGPLTRTAAGYDTSATIGRWVQHSGVKTRSSKLSMGASSRRAQRMGAVQ